MNDKVEGIILSVSDYKENDQLLSVFTRDYGVISLISKGTKKMASHHHFMPYYLYEFIIDYKDNKTIFFSRGYKLLETYYREDIKLLSMNNIFSEVINKNREIINKDDYDSIKFLFNEMNLDNYLLIGSLFFSMMLKKAGITPFVDGCVICGEKKVIGLSKKDGGFVCKNHATENDILAVETLKKYRLLIKANISDYILIKDNKVDKNDFSLLVDFYISNTEMKINSYNFFMLLD